MNHVEPVIRRDPQVCFTQINSDEIVILNPVDGNFYHLNESAVDLWLSLEAPKTPLELAQMLAKKYAGYPEDYQNDIKEWIDDTTRNGLLISMDIVDAKAI